MHRNEKVKATIGKMVECVTDAMGAAEACERSEILIGIAKYQRPADLRLIAGEISASEMRVTQAVLSAIVREIEARGEWEG